MHVFEIHKILKSILFNVQYWIILDEIFSHGNAKFHCSLFQFSNSPEICIKMASAIEAFSTWKFCYQKSKLKFPSWAQNDNNNKNNLKLHNT